MTNVPPPEQSDLKPDEVGEAGKLRDSLESRVADAEPASTDAQGPPEQTGENEKLKLAVDDRSFDAATEAEAKLKDTSDLNDGAWRVEQGDVVEHQYVDRQGRPLEVRLHSKVDSQTYTGDDARYYRLEHSNREVGRLDMNLEHSQQYDAQTDTYSRQYDRAKITYVEVHPEYRGAGSGSELLKVAEREARLHGVQEIYGDPQNDGARTFFERNADQGWQVADLPSHAHGRAKKIL